MSRFTRPMGYNPQLAQQQQVRHQQEHDRQRDEESALRRSLGFESSSSDEGSAGSSGGESDYSSDGEGVTVEEYDSLQQQYIDALQQVQEIGERERTMADSVASMRVMSKSQTAILKRTFMARMEKRDRLFTDVLDAMAEMEDRLGEADQRQSDAFGDQADALAAADERALSAGGGRAGAGAAGGGGGEEATALRVQLNSLQMENSVLRRGLDALATTEQRDALRAAAAAPPPSTDAAAGTAADEGAGSGQGNGESEGKADASTASSPTATGASENQTESEGGGGGDSGGGSAAAAVSAPPSARQKELEKKLKQAAVALKMLKAASKKASKKWEAEKKTLVKLLQDAKRELDKRKKSSAAAKMKMAAMASALKKAKKAMDKAGVSGGGSSGTDSGAVSDVSSDAASSSGAAPPAPPGGADGSTPPPAPGSGGDSAALAAKVTALKAEKKAMAKEMSKMKKALKALAKKQQSSAPAAPGAPADGAAIAAATAAAAAAAEEASTLRTQLQEKEAAAAAAAAASAAEVARLQAAVESASSAGEGAAAAASAAAASAAASALAEAVAAAEQKAAAAAAAAAEAAAEARATAVAEAAAAARASASAEVRAEAAAAAESAKAEMAAALQSAAAASAAKEKALATRITTLQRQSSSTVAGLRGVRTASAALSSSAQLLRSTARSELQQLPSIMQTTSTAILSRVTALSGQVGGLQAKLATEYRTRRELFNLVQELRGNIRVFCRVRPPNREEKAAGHPVCVSFPDEGEVAIANPAGRSKKWEFDHVFGVSSTNTQVFTQSEPLVVSVMDGYNACIFAYGQTGTGKTYTMEGPPADRGVNFRSLQRLFAVRDERQDMFRYTLTVALLEIYNEQIHDLLSDGVGQRKLTVRKGEHGMYVPDLTMVPVESLEEVLELMAMGYSNRASACTDMNEHSSRSHCMLSVYVSATNISTGAVSRGKLHLIDLAGSERLNKTNAKGARLKEAQKINLSLSALGDVISSRVAKAGHVPYRNSTLTYLLQDSLEGDSKTLMIVCASPVEFNREETVCSLNFAARARNVELGKAKKHTSRGARK